MGENVSPPFIGVLPKTVRLINFPQFFTPGRAQGWLVMIASIRGRVIETLADSVVIEVGGVGLQVYVPAPLKDILRPGDSAFLHTYLVVREDALTLFGFEHLEGRNFPSSC